MTKMILIQTSILPVCSDGATKLVSTEWNNKRKKKKI